jgi:hypothetical protein
MATESFRQRGKNLRPGRLHLAGNQVGVDDHCTALCQEPTDRGLSGSNTSGEADKFHEPPP